ncbi:FAD dependent oxidoreductase [Pavlovales sp. CCMP2436]|nr:FAD dependent oxidoreductase [Pavlovales sp. CCMP2436]
MIAQGFRARHSPPHAEVARSLREGGAARTLAVVGGGLAGMSVAFHATQLDSSVGVAIFDAAKPGEGGASAAAAGLLHPLTKRGGLIWRGVESFDSAARLVQRTQAHADEAHAPGPPQPFCFEHGVLRVARSEAQAKMYEDSAAKARWRCADSPHAAEHFSWVDGQQARALIGEAAAPSDCAGGVWCARGLCIDAPSYLRALWAATAEAAASARWCVVEVRALAELCAQFDAVVVAVGAASANVPGLEKQPLSLVRGQTLCYRMPVEACPRVGVLGGVYLVPLEDAPGGRRVIGGATYEPLGMGAEAEVEVDADAPSAALADLRVQLGLLWPPSEGAQLKGGRLHGSGIRAVPPRTHRVPLTGRVPGTENAWFVTGLGGRGLLYHAELGRTVAAAALTNDNGALLSETTAKRT